jgi:hypothetical protein
LKKHFENEAGNASTDHDGNDIPLPFHHAREGNRAEYTRRLAIHPTSSIRILAKLRDQQKGAA